MPRNKVHSTYKTDSLSHILLSLAILISVFLGSQSFLSSFPSSILITNDTKFTTTFTSISANQVTFSDSSLSQSITPDDILPLRQGGYIRFKANQVQNPSIREALKYSRYQFNHILFYEQSLNPWSFTESDSMVLSTNILSQRVSLSFSKNLNALEVTTPTSHYYVSLPINSFALVTDDGNALLYKLYRIDDSNISITLIGLYPSNSAIYQS